MCAHMRMEHLCLTTPQFRLVCYLCYYIVIIHGLCIYIYIDKYVCLYIYIYIPERNDGACQWYHSISAQDSCEIDISKPDPVGFILHVHGV